MANTAKEQYISNHPLSLLWGILSTIALASLIYFFLLYTTKAEIHCVRQNNNKGFCTFSTDHYLWKNEQKLNLNQITNVKAAIVESQDDDNVEITIYTTEKEKPELKILNSNNLNILEGKFKIADDYNNFLKEKTQKSFDKSFDNGNIPFICIGILVLVTGWGILYYLYLILKKL